MCNRALFVYIHSAVLFSVWDYFNSKYRITCLSVFLFISLTFHLPCLSLHCNQTTKEAAEKWERLWLAHIRPKGPRPVSSVAPHLESPAGPAASLQPSSSNTTTAPWGAPSARNYTRTVTRTRHTHDQHTSQTLPVTFCWYWNSEAKFLLFAEDWKKK